MRCRGQPLPTASHNASNSVNNYLSIASITTFVVLQITILPVYTQICSSKKKRICLFAGYVLHKKQGKVFLVHLMQNRPSSGYVLHSLD